MKKTLKCIICCLLCIAMVNLPAFAAEEHTMNIEWEGDYANNKIVIKFESHADYIQQVMAVMYPASVVTPAITDYVRITEVTATPGKVGTVEFTMTNLTGDYTLKLSGNGYMDGVCWEEKVIKIIAANSYSVFNTANADNIAGYIAGVEEALGLEVLPAGSLKTAVMNEFLTVRDTEYAGEFTNLNQVRDAYNKALIIAKLHNGTSASDFAGVVEKYAELLGLKAYVADDDYEANKSNIYANVVSKKSSINNCTQLVDAIKKFGAMEEINKATAETLHNVMVKYHNDLGVSADSWTTYTGLGEQQSSVLQYLTIKKGEQTGGKFTEPSVAKAAFEAGVAGVGGNDGGEGPAGPSGPSGDSGSDGFGMGNDNGSLSQKPDPVPVVKGFFDCNETHWAYTYVKDLYDLGFISGYADGSFLPDNSVTREEFVKMVIGATGLYDINANCTFGDVPSTSWSYKYVASAYTHGIVLGNSASDFGAKNYITREDVCVISARILAKYGKQLDGESSFTDADSVSDYAKDSVDALVELGIINGFEDGSFGAKKLLTRAQAAKIISLLRASI